MEVDFSIGNANIDNMEAQHVLIGLLNRFNNSFQAVADQMFEELSWKQEFFMNCVTLFEEAPTIKDMAKLVGCSHQNAKQILSKLEKLGYLQVQQDSVDKRKQRIFLTEKVAEFKRHYASTIEQATEQLFSGMSKEAIDSMVQSLLHLIANVNAMKEGQNENDRNL